MFVSLSARLEFRQQLGGAFSIAAAVIARNLVCFAIAIDSAIDASLVTGEFHKRLADFPAESFQPGIPRALLSLAPCHGRIEPGKAPDMADGRRLGDIDVRQEPGGDHRADAVNR